MTLKNRATAVIGAILVGGAIVLTSLHFMAENGQMVPASMTAGATKSDQRDAVVSNDVANHKK